MNDHRSPVRLRWVVAGALSVLAVASFSFLGPYLGFVAKSSNPNGWGMMPLGGSILFFAVCGANELRRRAGREPFFTPGEALGLFFVMVMGGWASSNWSFVELQMPLLTSPGVFASAENGWSERIIPHLPRWAMGPLDEPYASAFYNGLPAGGSIPWGRWALPVAAWSAFAVALALFSVALGGFFSKQWIEHDRLTFPHAEVLLGVARGFLGTRLFWIGVAVAAAVPAWNLMQRFFPVFQPIYLNFGGGGPDGMEWLKGIPKEYWLSMNLNFAMVGLIYFVHRDIISSIIIFFILMGLQGYAVSLVGVNLPHADLYGIGAGTSSWQMSGALMSFVALGLWSARGWLKSYVKAGIRGENPGASWLSPRTTLAIFVLGLAGVVAYMMGLGLRSIALLPFMVTKLFGYIGIARITAEAAVDADMGTDPVDMAVAWGTRFIGPAGFVALALSYGWLTSNSTNMAMRAVQGERLNAGVRFPRGVFGLVLAAVAVSTACAMLGTIWTAYNHGANNFGIWQYQWHMRIMYDRATECSRTPLGPDWPRLGWWASGAAGMALLVFLRNNVVGWFLHPVGLLVGMAGKGVVFNGAVAWTMKTVFLKLGGVESYERNKPFFAGLVMGNLIPWAITTVLDPIFFLHRGTAMQ